MDDGVIGVFQAILSKNKFPQKNAPEKFLAELKEVAHDRDCSIISLMVELEEALKVDP